jgi:ABC-2 type transport system permease protein
VSSQPVFGAVGASGRRRWRWHARMIWVLAKTQFKLRYTDSALGYFWSLARPLALFAILYVIFGRALGLGTVEHYAVFLLLGVVLFTFFQEATSRTMSSIVDQNQLLRRLAFPRVIVPMSVSVTSLINFALNLAAVAAFVAWERIVPRVEWLLLVPLFLELYVFVIALSLILATLFARLQDVGAIWEVLTRVFFYASGVIFPLQLLPSWAELIVLLNPFTQVMQDVRAVILHDVDVVTASSVLGGIGGRLVPVVATAALALFGYAFFKRNESWFAEQV